MRTRNYTTNNIKDKYWVCGSVAHHIIVLLKKQMKNIHTCIIYKLLLYYVITKLKYCFISFLYEESNE